MYNLSIMKKNICTYCGNGSVDVKEYEMEISEIYSESRTVKLKELHCTSCGFSEEHVDNDLILNKEFAILKRKSIINIIESLNSDGYSNAAMERVLALPARTIARWKNDQSISPSAAAFTLMKIVRTFPWVLEVAGSKFDEESANKILNKHTAKSLDS